MDIVRRHSSETEGSFQLGTAEVAVYKEFVEEVLGGPDLEPDGSPTYEQVLRDSWIVVYGHAVGAHRVTSMDIGEPGVHIPQNLPRLLERVDLDYDRVQRELKAVDPRWETHSLRLSADLHTYAQHLRYETIKFGLTKVQELSGSNGDTSAADYAVALIRAEAAEAGQEERQRLADLVWDSVKVSEAALVLQELGRARLRSKAGIQPVDRTLSRTV
jgi:hypothetical protein